MKTIKLEAAVTALDVSKAKAQSGTFSIVSFKPRRDGAILKYMGELPRYLEFRAA